METNQEFEYTYCAGNADEVMRIRQKYLPQQEDELAQLRKLDQCPHRKATAWAIALGVVGALVMGTGMSLVMSPLGSGLGIWSTVLGIPLGLVGMGLAVAAYPAYRRVLRRQREKLAPTILALTEALMKKEKT